MKNDKDISLADKLTRKQLVELDACTRCNECLKWCPVLDITKDESLTTPEKIRIFSLLIRARHGLRRLLLGIPPLEPKVMEKLTEALYTCTTCGRCGEICEVGINTQRLWPVLRAKLVELGYGPVGDQRLTETMVREKRNPYDGALEARFDWLPADIEVAPKADIGYFAGCSGSYTAQPMMIGAVKVMQAAGVEFAMLAEEWCCGFPLMIIGEVNLLKELITHNVEGFIERGIERLVVSCPCCMFMIKEHWPYYFGRALPFEVVHISQIMVERIDAGQLKLTKELPETVTYHDPCYLARGTRVTEEPRQVVAQFKDVNFVEMKENRELAKCCGAGGGIRRAFKELSIDMARALIRDAEGVGAEILIIDCPACYERLHLALEGFTTPVKIVDLMELAAELL